MGIAEPSPSRPFSKSPARRDQGLVVSHSRSLAAKLYEDFRPGVRQLPKLVAPSTTPRLWCVWTASTVSSRGTLTSFVVDDRPSRSSCTSTPTQMVKRTQNSWLMETPPRGEDDLPRRRPWMRPSSRTSCHFCAIKSCAPIWIRNRYACAVQQASRVRRASRRHHRRGLLSTPRATKVLDLCSREEGRVARAPRSSRRSRRIHLRAPTVPGSRCATRGRERDLRNVDQSGSSGLLV
jgi:hypothetical protein